MFVIAGNISFQAKYLQETARTLELNMLDTLGSGSKNIINYKGYRVIIIKNDNDVITHIGRHLFAPGLREDHPSPIYNYIEYAMLDNQFHFTENPFVYKDLKFIEGDWTDMETITENTPFEINVYQDKLYVVRWLLSDKKNVELMFPINYERLSLTNRKELEQNIIRDLRNYKFEKNISCLVDINTLDQLNEEVWIKEGETYLSPEISNNIYYSIDSIDSNYLCDPNYPIETLSNLCLVADKMDPSCKIEIKFMKYDYTQETLTLNMDDLIAYMRSEGCVPYWGTEKNENGVIEGSLFFYNRDKGYDHIFKIETTMQDLFLSPMRIKAIAYLLSPTSNVKNLNYKYSR